MPTVCLQYGVELFQGLHTSPIVQLVIMTMVERLRDRGVLATGLHRLRLVTHLDVSRAQVDHAVAVLRECLSAS